MILDEVFSSSWESYLRASSFDGCDERATFRRQLYRQGLEHVFPPPIFFHSFIDDLANTSLSLLNIIASIPSRFFQNNFHDWLDFLGVDATEAEFLLRLCSPRFMNMATQFARPDFLITEDGARVVEINISAPIGGMNTCDPFVEEFRKTGYYAYLQAIGANLYSPSVSKIWNQAFLEVSRTGSKIESPILFEAIANPNDIDSGRKHFVNMVKQAGFTVISGLIQQLEVTTNGIYFRNQRINTIFTMFTWSELRRFVPFELVIDLAEADEAGLVDFIAPPTSAFFDHKANLELLTSDVYSVYFSDTERELITRYVPRTFRLKEDRIGHVLRDQDELVLKPASEYGGKGIMFGNQVSKRSWEHAIMMAAQKPNTFICQEKVANLWRYSIAGGDSSNQYLVCLGPMIFGHQYAGTLLRQSIDHGVAPVINAAQGAEAGTALVNHPLLR
jgi:glutathionylspermidine synthase